MKSKTKPVKGSARTQRFDVGGTVGALAGLGTLAYLLSRKKKGAEGAPDIAKTMTARSAMGEGDAEPYKAVGNEGKEDVFKGGMSYKKPEASTAVDTSDKAAKDAANAAKDAKKVKPVKKAAANNAANAVAVAVAADKAPAYTGTGMEGSDKGAPPVPTLKGGESKAVGEGKLKPYPANLPAVKEAQRKKFLESQAGMKRTGITTPGDPSKKEATSKVAKAVKGTIDNAGKSMARTPEQKMAAGAREVERRRQEEKAAKQGYGIKKGGMVKKYASGGSVSSASKRADGIAQRGKTRGKVC